MENIVRKVFSSDVKAFNDEELTIEHFISTEQEDRSKDIVRADGMELDGVPVVLKQHGRDPDTGSEPIAKPLSIKVATNDKGIKGILVKTQYYDGSKLSPPDNTGRRLFEKAKQGFMPYWSIGFKGEGTPRSGGGVEYKRWSLFEYSQVGVPDNIGAEVIKEMAADEIKEVARKDNALIEFAVEQKAKGAPPVSTTIADELAFDDDVFDLLKEHTSEEIRAALTVKTGLKSIAARVASEIPWESMRALWYGFLGEVSQCDGSEKTVKAIVKEFAELVAPYATAFALSLHGDSNDTNEVIKEQIKNGYYDKPVAENAAPTESPVVEPEEKTTAIHIHKAVLGLVENKQQPQGMRLSFKKEDLQALVREAVGSELKTAINKMKGKV